MKNPRGASSVFNGLQVFFNPDTKLEKGKALRTTYAQIPANSLGIGSLATFVSHTLRELSAAPGVYTYVSLKLG